MYYYWKNGFDEKDCNELIEKYTSTDLMQAAIGSGPENASNVDPCVRKTKVCFIEPNIIFAKALWSYILEANSKSFNYFISGVQKAQFAKYEIGDFYEWHKDSTDNPSANDFDSLIPVRKLSAVVQLSKQEDYEGGELQFFNGSHTPEKLPIEKQGSVIVFDSGDWHRASPVTKGVRYSLVLWATGKRSR